MSARQILSDLSAAPGARLKLARIGLLASGPLWVAQAACIAWVIQSWLDAAPVLWPVVGFAVAGGLRALIHRASRAVIYDDAQDRIARMRADLILAETQCGERVQSSSAFAALICEKLPLLLPYLTRYRPAFLRARFLPVFFIAVSAVFSWAVALILLIALPLVPVFMVLVGMAAKDASDRQMAEVGSLNTLLADRLAAVVDLRLLDAGDRATADFATRAESLRDRTMAVLRIAFLSSTVLELLAAIGVAMVAVYVGFSLLGELNFGTWGAPITPGAGIFLLLLAPDAFQPLRDLATAWHDKSAAEAVADEIAALQATPRERILGDGKATASPMTRAGLTMRGATVHRGDTVLNLPDLDIAPGETVALVGASGRGKTTTLRALAGLLPLASGTVSIGGDTMTDATADRLRGALAWVPQSVRFPDVSLAAFLDPRGTPEDRAAALRAAEVSDVVNRLPGGMATRLGETGSGLSGGEARRLMLARAFYRHPAILLADEPTADLNEDLVDRIVNSLKRCAAEGTAVLIATHDPRVADAMDRVVVMS